MDIELELCGTETSNIILIVKGRALGQVHFPDFATFEEFVLACHNLIESYNNHIDNKCEIPEAILKAFDDDGYCLNP